MLGHSASGAAGSATDTILPVSLHRWGLDDAEVMQGDLATLSAQVGTFMRDVDAFVCAMPDRAAAIDDHSALCMKFTSAWRDLCIEWYFDALSSSRYLSSTMHNLLTSRHEYLAERRPGSNTSSRLLAHRSDHLGCRTQNKSTSGTTPVDATVLSTLSIYINTAAVKLDENLETTMSSVCTTRGATHLPKSIISQKRCGSARASVAPGTPASRAQRSSPPTSADRRRSAKMLYAGTASDSSCKGGI